MAAFDHRPGGEEESRCRADARRAGLAERGRVALLPGSAKRRSACGTRGGFPGGTQPELPTGNPQRGPRSRLPAFLTGASDVSRMEG